MVTTPEARERLRFAAAAAIGFAVSTATIAGIAGSVAAPAVILCQRKRRIAWQTAVGFYGAALWPLVPGARNFFGGDASIISALGLWLLAVLLLASPWALVWSRRTWQAIWRGPVAIVLAVFPPLGIIGWASPLVVAGILFPGLRWIGLALCMILTGSLAVWPRYALFTGAVIALSANLLYRQPGPPPGWEGVNTNFGSIAHGSASLAAEYGAAQWIQNRALSSAAKVIVFPETVVPMWTAATDAFWRPTLDALGARGKTILVGARVMAPTPYADAPPGMEFSAALATLTSFSSQRSKPLPFIGRWTTSEFPYENAVLIRGANAGAFIQHVPVPIGMWNPMRTGTAKMHLLGPGVVAIERERVAILICYEQTLTWPVLRSMMESPTMLIGVANDYWAEGTTIAEFQRESVRSWARLMGIPYIVAINT